MTTAAVRGARREAPCGAPRGARRGARRAPLDATMLLLLFAAILAVLLLAPAPAGAKTVTVKGAKAPGPERYDKVFVSKFGPAKAKRVLVLVPGTIGGAGTFSLVAQELVERVPRLQVWALDRRSQALEDTSMFERALRGDATPDDALDYYVGWILDPSIQPRHQPIDEADFGFARRWGLRVSINDLRNVVRKAGQRGRKVILGGHSLGASTALAYAAWDFKGRPGFRDIDGVVLIDGGLLGTYKGTNRREAKRALAMLEASSPFADILELEIPWAAGVLTELGALYAKLDPTGPSTVQDFPLIPPEFRPPVPVTNRAFLGYALDADTSPEDLGMIHVRAGGLAASGDPRDWEDGEVSPIARVADALGGEPNGVEWYYPRRLNIDVDGTDKMKRNRVTNLLGVRTWHTRQVRLSLYALETSLNEGRVLRGARRFAKRSRVRRKDLVLADASATNSHLDPLMAAPQTNEFLRTVVPFLKRTFR